MTLTHIVSQAITLATKGRDVTVVADDTDVILLLVYHMKDTMSDIYFCTVKSKKTWSIRDIIRTVGPLVKHHILFLHAWTGCDVSNIWTRKNKPPQEAGVIKRIAELVRYN